MIQAKYYSIYTIMGIIIASSIASMGTIPYGFQFAQKLNPYGHLLSVFIGVIFAFTAAFANAVLGVFSFMSIDTKQRLINPYYLMAGSTISAIPMGCMCYFAYKSILPLFVNVIFTLIVTLINAAIGYAAILNLVKEVQYRKSLKIKTSEILCRVGGLIIGTCVSLGAYMAAIQGLTGLFHMGIQKEELAYKLACALGFITWVPFAALFSNATQLAAGKLYYFVKDFSKKIKQIHVSTILLFIFSFCSAASFTQVVIIFFGPDMQIPSLFKLATMQTLIYHVLAPLAFFSSGAVNFMALEGILNLNHTQNHGHKK